jgi:hypothetical protein
MSEENGTVPNLNWKGSIATNIEFFREQNRLLNNLYNPSQVASGAIMTVLIMNHNLAMQQLAAINYRLEQIEAHLTKRM